MAFKVTFRGKDLGVFDANEVTMNEAVQLEEQTGMTVNEMIDSMSRSSSRGTRAIVWFQALRRGEHVDLNQDFKFGELSAQAIDEPDPTPAPVIELAGADRDSPSKNAVRGGSRSSLTTSA